MVKRAREEGDAGSFAAKRLHQQQHAAWPMPATAQMDAEMLAGVQQQQAALRQQPEQHAAPSTCTDIVLYRPTPTRLDGLPADTTALLAQLAGGGDAVAQLLPTGSNDTAQLKSLWRSLSSTQRRSLAGMWQQLRDGRVMLAALPGNGMQQHDGVLNGIRNGFESPATCVIQELDDDDDDGEHSAKQQQQQQYLQLQQQQQAYAKQQQVVVPAIDSTMALDGAAGQQQQQQQQPAAVWTGSLQPAGSAPMDMDMEG